VGGASGRRPPTHARAAPWATHGRAARDNRRARQRCMTTAAISAPSMRTLGRLGASLSVRRWLRVAAARALTLDGLYELARGLVGADRAEADAHAHRLVALERSLHFFVEANVQRAVQTLPGLTSLLGVAYLTLHLAVTAGVLLWLHHRRPEGFPFVRT